MTLVDFASGVQSLGLLLPALLIILKATLILLIARLLVAALPRLSAAAKHLILTIALCSVIALPLFEMAFPAWRVAVFQPAATAGASPKAPAAIGVTGEEDDLPPTAVAAAVTVAKAAGIVPEEKIDAFSRGLDLARQSWQGFLFLAIAAGSILFLFRMLAGIAGVGAVARVSGEISDANALRELGAACDHLRLRRPVRLLQSERVSVPVVWGLRKPILLLPASWNEWPAERLRVVLLHELAHLKRGDSLTLLVTRAAVALFWFHPLMWSLERLARAEAERACDDLVLESGTKPSDYAEHLLQIARAIPQVDPFRSVTLAMSRRSQLEGRLLSILQPHIRRVHFSTAAVVVAAALAVVVLIPLSEMRLVAAPRPSSSTITVVADKETKRPAFDFQRLVDSTEVLFARYERLTTRRAPESGHEWYEQGMHFHGKRQFPDAIASFKQSAAHGYRVDDSLYNIACGYAQMGDAPDAVKWLRDAIAAGYSNFHHIESDSDFDPVRSDAAFRRLVAEAPERERQEDGAGSALKQYATLRGLPDADGREWFSVGYDLLPAGRFDESVDAFQHALAKGYKPATSTYNIACGYSRKGDTAHAMEWLQRALDEGFDSTDKFEDDPDLDNVRHDPRFAGLLQMATDLRLHSKNILQIIAGGEDWPSSLPHFRAMTQKYPRAGRSWFNLGYAALQAGNNGESVNAFQRALALGYRTQATTYDIACAYARSNQTDLALAWLEKARAAGFPLSEYIEHDKDLSSLRSDPRFRELRKEVWTGK